MNLCHIICSGPVFLRHTVVKLVTIHAVMFARRKSTLGSNFLLYVSRFYVAQFTR